MRLMDEQDQLGIYNVDMGEALMREQAGLAPQSQKEAGTDGLHVTFLDLDDIDGSWEALQAMIAAARARKGKR